MPSLAVTFIVMIPLSVPTGVPVNVYVDELNYTQAGKTAPLDKVAV